MNSKVFSERFNRELTMAGFPEDISKKTQAVATVFNVKRHFANALLFGQILPSGEQLDHIAEILEVCPLWLSGVTNKKKGYSVKEVTDLA